MTGTDERAAPGPWMDPYPQPLDEAAYHGVLGEIVRRLAPQTEADPMGILASAIASVGNMLGTGVYARAGGKRHPARLNVLLVGPTAARKGTAQALADEVLAVAAPLWRTQRRGSGLSSGEGLIAAVQDPTYKKDPIKVKGRVVDYQEVIDHPGVDDKRLLVVEEEFGRTLRALGRDNNTLSPIVRDAFDGNPLRTLTKNPVHATDAHITIAGHITPSELKELLRTSDMANGLANRFLFFAVRRARFLPGGGGLDAGEVSYLGGLLGGIAEELRGQSRELRRDPDAEALWARVYPALTGDRPGMFGAITSRAEAQCLRLSVLYAALDEATAIRPVHVRAALTVWRYCEETVRCLFGTNTGDPVMETILAGLAERPRTVTEISNLFGKHLAIDQRDETLALLAEQGLVIAEDVATRGRSKTVWRLMTADERKERGE